MTATVLVTDYAWESLEVERAILARADARLMVADTGTQEELIAMAPFADAILKKLIAEIANLPPTTEQVSALPASSSAR